MEGRSYWECLFSEPRKIKKETCPVSADDSILEENDAGIGHIEVGVSILHWIVREASRKVTVVIVHRVHRAIR